jgi:hypothetical protein
MNSKKKRVKEFSKQHIYQTICKETTKPDIKEQAAIQSQQLIDKSKEAINPVEQYANDKECQYCRHLVGKIKEIERPEERLYSNYII